MVHSDIRILVITQIRNFIIECKVFLFVIVHFLSYSLLPPLPCAAFVFLS